MRKTMISFLLLLIISISAISVANASTNTEKTYDKTFFEKHKKAVILEELAKEGLQYDESLSLDTIEVDLAKKATKDNTKVKLKEKVKQLRDADYVFLDENGEVYSSKRGYLGKAEKINGYENEIENYQTSATITPMSKSDPTPSEIFGGKTGAFERRQLNFSGFDGIIANVTLPEISNLPSSGEQPWVYYGFDPTSGTGVEGGYSYQKGDGINTFPRWRPYIKSGAYLYADEAYSKHDGDVINNLKFYVKKASATDTYYTAYLIVGATQVKVAPTSFTSITNLSVKRNTSIASTFNFDGTNIVTKSQNQKWDNVQVSLYNSDYYYSWSNYSEYSEWKLNSSTGTYMWYGTIDCVPSYLHRSNGYTSIYKP